MKKIFILSCLVILCYTVSAQDGTDFGVKAGVNLANLSVEDDTSDNSMLISFHAGALAHIHLNESWAVQPELLFSGQGVKYDVLGEDLKVMVNYISLPILLQYMFDNGFRIETGPQLGMLISANSKLGDGDSQDIKDSFKSIDFGWVLGLGYLFDGGFGIDARYQFGIANISEFDEPKISNRVIQAGLFYQFGGKDHE